MVDLTEAMKDMIKNELCYIATVDNHGNPDVGPKATMRVLDDTYLIYNEFTGKQTMENIQANGKALVAVANKQTFRGFRFLGHATIETSGPAYDSEVKLNEGAGQPKPKQVGVIEIDAIYLLDAGPKAGTKIE